MVCECTYVSYQWFYCAIKVDRVDIQYGELAMIYMGDMELVMGQGGLVCICFINYQYYKQSYLVEFIFFYILDHLSKYLPCCRPTVLFFYHAYPLFWTTV